MKTKKITGKILLLLILIAAMTSCISSNPIVQVYSGPKLERAEVARITMDPSLGVRYVNRADPLPSATMRTMTLELLPGKYNITLFYNDGYQDSVNNLDVMVFVVAGRSYHIYDGYMGDSWDPYCLEN
jgi:hypothetical protein